MADRRIRLPKDKEAFIANLTEGKSSGPFLTRASLMTFAACYGFAKGARIPFTETLEPIRQEVFERLGHDTVINLLSLAATGDPKVLAQNEKAEEVRAAIFEEYANGGLERLRTELHGVDDPFQHLLLLIDQERQKVEDDQELDLTRLIMD